MQPNQFDTMKAIIAFIDNAMIEAMFTTGNEKGAAMYAGVIRNDGIEHVLLAFNKLFKTADLMSPFVEQRVKDAFVMVTVKESAVYAQSLFI